MLKYTSAVNGPIHKLIETTRNLRFGEIYGVEIALEDPWTFIEVSTNERDLIEQIKDGLQYIDVLTVHNGEPVLAEVDDKVNGFRTRQKIKFPTVRAEGWA